MLGHRVADVVLIRTLVAAAIVLSCAGADGPAEEARWEAAPQVPAPAAQPADVLAARRALAAAGRAPLFPRWRRGEVLSVDGTPMTDVTRPFDSWTVAARRAPELFPRTVAEPERWAEVQEQLLPIGGCPCTGGSGHPGEVPAPTLRVTKSAVPGQVVLTWSGSCLPDATDYSVHEGRLRSWYTHAARACSTAGSLSYTFAPSPGNRYFLVVPLTPDDEGSYGRRSDGEERPPGFPSCRATALAEACP